MVDVSQVKLNYSINNNPPTDAPKPQVKKTNLLSQPIKDEVSFGHSQEKQEKSGSVLGKLIGLGVAAFGTYMLVKHHKTILAKFKPAKAAAQDVAEQAQEVVKTTPTVTEGSKVVKPSTITKTDSPYVGDYELVRDQKSLKYFEKETLDSTRAKSLVKPEVKNVEPEVKLLTYQPTVSSTKLLGSKEAIQLPYSPKPRDIAEVTYVGKGDPRLPKKAPELSVKPVDVAQVTYAGKGDPVALAKSPHPVAPDYSNIYVGSADKGKVAPKTFVSPTYEHIYKGEKPLVKGEKSPVVTKNVVDKSFETTQIPWDPSRAPKKGDSLIRTEVNGVEFYKHKTWVEPSAVPSVSPKASDAPIGVPKSRKGPAPFVKSTNHLAEDVVKAETASVAPKTGFLKNVTDDLRLKGTYLGESFKSGMKSLFGLPNKTKIGETIDN